MYIAEIKFFLLGEYDVEIESSIDSFIRHLRYNGRIVGKPSFLIKKENFCSIVCKTPELRALSKIESLYSKRKYVKKSVTVKSEIIGKNLWSIETCNCKETGFYILQGAEDTPLFCGSCGKIVPLYRIPPTYEEDPSFYDLICWNIENLAWSDIEFHSVLSSIAQQQIHDINSDHNKKALLISGKISEITGVCCYYYVENASENKKSNFSNVCPKCEKNWVIEEPILKQYNYKCDKCRLLG